MSDRPARAGLPLAVHLLLRDESRTLFLRRANTGYEDGRLSLPAGHVEAGESALAALSREAKEELGIDVDPSDTTFVLVQHKRDPADGEERVDLFFALRRGAHQPLNREPRKCSELVWADTAVPPADSIAYIRNAIQAINKGVKYAEFGW